MADNVSSQVETAARAVHAALDFNSSPESRLAATSFLDSLKTGDVQVLGATASALVKQISMPSEVRHYGLKLLQYLVRIRSDELTVQIRSQLADLVLGMLPEIATSQEEWFLKSQTAALVAEVVRHEDTSLWQGFLSKFTELAVMGPSYAELVVTVLRWLPEDITVYNEDLEGDRRRQLLHSLTQALSQIFPLLFKMLEFHFGEALRFLQQNQLLVIAKQHACVVDATLSAVLAYVEWAPVDKIEEHGLIEACGFMLKTAEFRQQSCEIMKQIASRRRPTDKSALVYDTALRHVLHVLCETSRVIQTGPLTRNDDDSEFIECLSEAMAALGSQNLQCFVGFQDHLTVYLQQMLGYFQYSRIGIHFPALLFWLGLIRAIPLDPGYDLRNELIADKLGVLGPKMKDKKSAIVVVSNEVYASLLDCSFNWFFQKSSKVHLNENSGKSNEELSDAKDYGNYHGRLLELVRLVGERSPCLAAVKVSDKVQEACGSSLNPELALAVLDRSQKLLDVIIHAIFDGENPMTIKSLPSLQSHLKGILGMLLMAKWNGAAFVEIHGRLLDAMGLFLRTSSDATLTVLNKIFELLTSLPVISKGVTNDPARIENSRARVQVCTSFLRIAKAADKTVSGHLEVIWKTISTLQEQHLLQQGEFNLIAEAFLIAGSAAGRECEAKALACFFNPLQDRWNRSAWQEQYLMRHGDLVALLTRQTVDGSQNEELWSMYHSVTFTERVIKRCAVQQSEIITAAREPLHPLTMHIKWILTPILQLLRCIHAFWSPKVKPSLPPMVQAALLMSTAEQASIIGEVGSRTSRLNARATSELDMQTSSQTGGKENEIRNWLKGVRDSSYSIIGLAATHFTDILLGHDCDIVHVALLENIETMEFRHLRLLLHFVVIPLVKACPFYLRDLWLGKLLPGPLIVCDLALSSSWMSLIKDGEVKLSESILLNEGLGIKAEVLQEKLLRDLSRETCALLSVLASPNLNLSLPSAEQLLQSRMEHQNLDNSSLFGPHCMMRFVMQNDGIAKSCLSICIQALKWPDSEAVHKALVFCDVIVTVAAISENSLLQDYVARDLFTAIIEALTLDSNVSAQAELVNVFRVIYLLLAQQHSAPRQILQSSPFITGDILSAFESALSSTSSAKEQRQYIKSLLLQAGGNSLKALIASKSTNLITNVATNRQRSAYRGASDEAGNIGLAALVGEQEAFTTS